VGTGGGEMGVVCSLDTVDTGGGTGPWVGAVVSSSSSMSIGTKGKRVGVDVVFAMGFAVGGGVVLAIGAKGKRVGVDVVFAMGLGVGVDVVFAMGLDVGVDVVLAMGLAMGAAVVKLAGIMSVTNIVSWTGVDPPPGLVEGAFVGEDVNGGHALVGMTAAIVASVGATVGTTGCGVGGLGGTAGGGFERVPVVLPVDGEGTCFASCGISSLGASACEFPTMVTSAQLMKISGADNGVARS